MRGMEMVAGSGGGSRGAEARAGSDRTELACAGSIYLRWCRGADSWLWGAEKMLDLVEEAKKAAKKEGKV